MLSLQSKNEKLKQFLEQEVLVNIYPPPDIEIIKTLCSKPTRINLQKAQTKQISAEIDLEVKQNVVNAVDGREKVNVTAQWPYSVHGLLTMNFNNKPTWGTGILIGPNVVLTAGHNLYDHDIDAFADLASMQFMPGMNGQSTPFGDLEVEKYYISPNYLKDKKREDYGILILKEPIGEKTGYFGLACLASEEILSKRINVTGYPADKVAEKPKMFEMWGMEGEANRIEEVQGHIKYMIDTGAGQSGSGVWYKEGEDYYVCGVHMAGTQYKLVNSATLLTRKIYQQIHEWLQQTRLQKLYFKLGKTKKIRLAEVEINPEDVSILMNYNLDELTCLDFSSKIIGRRGAEILTKNTSWDSLFELRLPSNNIGSEGLKALTENISWINLSKLDLHDNNLGVEGAKELAKCDAWKMLSALCLSDNNIGPEGCKALAENTFWVQLSQLNLGGNNIRAEGAQELAKNQYWKKLSILELQYNKIGAEGAKAIAENPCWKNVSKLNLCSNNLGDKGVKALAENTSWTKLSELDLSSNCLGVEGAKILADQISWTKLSILCLEDNKIRAQGVDMLSQKRDWRHLSV